MSKKDPVKEQSWIKKLENFKASGLTAVQWCEQNQENIHTFKYWKLRLSSTSKSLDFEEIESDSKQNEIKIIRKDFSIQLPIDADERTLKTLLQAIQRC